MERRTVHIVADYGESLRGGGSAEHGDFCDDVHIALRAVKGNDVVSQFVQKTGYGDVGEGSCDRRVERDMGGQSGVPFSVGVCASREVNDKLYFFVRRRLI